MSDFDWNENASGYVFANGKRLEAACWGKPPKDSLTLVLLHEGLGCVSLWRDFPQRLAEKTGHGVFAYSRAGYGNSDPADLPRPVNYMTLEAKNSLPEVLDAAGIGRCVLIGHSDGATISAEYAGNVFDPRVRGLVLIAPHFFTEQVGLKAIAEARHAFDEGDLKSKLGKYHKDPENAFRGWNDGWLNPDFHDWDVSDVIDHIRVPVLAIQGVGDEYGTLAQIQEIEDRIYAPLELAILDDCKHSPHVQQPSLTVEAIADFVERLERLEHASDQA